MEEYILPLNGLYYRINNFQPQRQTLVFIHGLTGSSSAWEKYEKRFENTYNLLTFDLRGHGKSKKYPSEKDYKIETIAKDLYDLVTFLKIEKFVLISHSFGTLIALEFLRQHPAMVTSVIFLNPAYHLKMIKFFIGFVASCLFLSKLLPFYSRRGKHIDYSQFTNSGDFDTKRIMLDTLSTTVAVYFYCLKQIYQYKYKNAWSEVNKPTLVLHGEKDKISSVDNAIEISHMIKGSKLIILPRANHITVFNNFEEVAEAIKNFVGQK